MNCATRPGTTKAKDNASNMKNDFCMIRVLLEMESQSRTTDEFAQL
jgi:hypothetical protein